MVEGGDRTRIRSSAVGGGCDSHPLDLAPVAAEDRGPWKRERQLGLKTGPTRERRGWRPGGPGSCDRVFVVTHGLDHPDTKSLATSGRRSYELAKTPDAALNLLDTPSNPPVLSRAEAKRSRGSEPFIILSDAGFTIYKPWRFLITSADGVASRDITVGPAITGRLVPTARGSRLDVGVKKFAVAPSQRSELVLAAVGLSAFVIAPIAIAGAHPVALALAAVSLLGVVGSVLFYRRRQRSEDIRGLLSIVGRTFGPLELSSAGESPRRRDEPGDEDP